MNSCKCVTCWNFDTFPSPFDKPPRYCCTDFTGENSFPKKVQYITEGLPKVSTCKAYNNGSRK